MNLAALALGALAQLQPLAAIDGLLLRGLAAPAHHDAAAAGLEAIVAAGGDDAAGALARLLDLHSTLRPRLDLAQRCLQARPPSDAAGDIGAAAAIRIAAALEWLDGDVETALRLSAQLRELQPSDPVVAIVLALRQRAGGRLDSPPDACALATLRAAQEDFGNDAVVLWLLVDTARWAAMPELAVERLDAWVRDGTHAALAVWADGLAAEIESRDLADTARASARVRRLAARLAAGGMETADRARVEELVDWYRQAEREQAAMEARHEALVAAASAGFAWFALLCAGAAAALRRVASLSSSAAATLCGAAFAGDRSAG